MIFFKKIFPSLIIFQRRVPFIKLIIPLLIGILFPLYEYITFFQCNIFFITSSIVITIGVLIRKSNIIFSIGVFFFLFCFITIDQKWQSNMFSSFVDTGKHNYVFVIEETPVEKNKSFKAEIRIIKEILNSDSHIETNIRSIAYFEKENLTKIPQIGQTWQANSYYSEIKNNVGSDFDYKHYLALKHIFSSTYIKSKSLNVVDEESIYPLRSFAENTKCAIIGVFKNHSFSDVQTGFASAILLGDKTTIDKTIKNNFQKSGLMHIMAVSGLHLGIIVLILNFLLSFMNRNNVLKYLKNLIVLVFVWFFAFLTGFSPSITRAALMFSLLVFALNSSKESNSLNIIFVSGFIILLVNPFVLFDVGFLLSYAAVLGIVVLFPSLSYWYTECNVIVKYFLDIISMSIAAQLFTLPIILYSFGSLPVYSILGNLIVIPLVFLITAISMIEIFLSQFQFLNFIGEVNKLLIDCTIRFVDYIAEIPKSTITLKISLIESVLISILVVIISIVFASYISKRKREFNAIPDLKK